MDKYTVDLDKVLNDFEYSELTDNFGTNKSYHPQGSSNYASSSKSKTGDAKHSITNVFHSLNEYLNTDISPNTTKIQLDNKESNYVASNKYFLQTTKNKDTTIDSSVDIDNKLKELELIEPVKEVKSDISSNLTVSDNSNSVDTLLDLTAGEIIIDNKVADAELIDEGKNRSIENLLDLDNIEIIEANLEEKIGDLTISEDENLLNLNSPCKNVEDHLELPHKHYNYDNITSNVIAEDIKPPIADIENTESTEVTENVGDSIQQEVSKHDTIQDSNTPNELHHKAIPEIDKDIVSFDNALDLDDSTLNRYLDELENEIQNEEELKSDILLIENNVKVKESTDIKETIVSSEIPTIKIIESTTIEENINEDVINKSVQLEREVVQEPPISDNIISEKIDIKVDIADKIDIKEDIGNKIDQKDAESVSSIERPKQLELSSSALDETSQRQINLIGNPGSTPYNNVYISKELQTTAAQKDHSSQDESETSPSVSPTFSEASTETITDSTDSESDEEVKTTETDDQKAKKEEIDDQNDVTPVNDPCSAVESCEVTSTSEVNISNPVIEENSSAAVTTTSLQPSESNASAQNNSESVGFWLGKEAPLWIPDSEALSCLHCDARFTVIKRRHHCRACGLVLCAKCCSLKYKLEYLDAEARVCSKCYAILNMDTNSSSGSEVSQTNSPNRQPNPNNPMEYCSVVPPMQQVGAVAQNPPTVMVPVGVLKRKGSAKGKSNKSVMFCDGIRPGSDLAKLDTDFNYSGQSSSSGNTKKAAQTVSIVNRDVPTLDPVTKSFIPNDSSCLPPTVTVFKSDITYIECINGENIVETLKCEKLTFALQRNLHVDVKIINMDCCINKEAWCFSTEGLISVGQDEIVYLIELIENEKTLPVDIFHHINSIYDDAVKGTTVTEMGLSLHNNPNFLDFKNHAGFLYIRPTFQCLQNIIRPTEPYLIGLLIHRWETPWAKIFPLRLVLRLGAEYRYYPTPIISTRHRDSVFVEIGHTIINILADFRNFSYTLPSIRGLTIHMEDKNTTVTIPENHYDQVMKSLSNSTDHILAFSGNFSTKADSHLVCVQDTQASSENSYKTHAINILNKPRKVTGASFIVFNGALKSTSGLTAKSSIVEDGLMIQIPPENMITLRESLRNMKNYTIQCGCINAPTDETVHIIWGNPDTNFNMGVTSPIDNEPLSGVPSIRIHNSKDFICNSGSRLIKWTEVFILQNMDEQSKAKDPVDISKISESISKATCQALVKYLDLLTSNNFYKIGIRTTLHVENVSYSAGSNNIKLPPIYMKNLDNELIPVLHRITSNNLGDNAITLELIFRILNT